MNGTWTTKRDNDIPEISERCYKKCVLFCFLESYTMILFFQFWQSTENISLKSSIIKCCIDQCTTYEFWEIHLEPHTSCWGLKWLKLLQSHSTVGRAKYSGFLLTPGKHFKPIDLSQSEVWAPIIPWEFKSLKYILLSDSFSTFQINILILNDMILCW